jgi:hypothetical protein
MQGNKCILRAEHGNLEDNPGDMKTKLPHLSATCRSPMNFTLSRYAALQTEHTSHFGLPVDVFCVKKINLRNASVQNRRQNCNKVLLEEVHILYLPGVFFIALWDTLMSIGIRESCGTTQQCQQCQDCLEFQQCQECLMCQQYQQCQQCLDCHQCFDCQQYLVC